jgi:hypothetical protein
MIADRKLWQRQIEREAYRRISLRARRRRPPGDPSQNPGDMKDRRRSDPRHLAPPPRIDPRRLIAC